MSYGLRVLHDSGNSTVISDKTKNYVFHGKATYSSAYCYYTRALANPPYDLRYWQLTYYVNCATRPLVYVEAPTNVSVGVETVSFVSGTQWKITIGVNGTGNTGPLAYPAVYCFVSLPADTPASGYGLAVFNASGELAFSSNTSLKYLEISHIFTATPPQSCGAHNYICDVDSYSSVPNSGTMPAKRAISSPVNAKAMNGNYYYGCAGQICLGEWNGSSFYMRWYQAFDTSSGQTTQVIDVSPRVVTIIDASKYD
jgi:hypothetical protein